MRHQVLPQVPTSQTLGDQAQDQGHRPFHYRESALVEQVTLGEVGLEERPV